MSSCSLDPAISFERCAVASTGLLQQTFGIIIIIRENFNVEGRFYKIFNVEGKGLVIFNVEGKTYYYSLLTKLGLEDCQDGLAGLDGKHDTQHGAGAHSERGPRATLWEIPGEHAGPGSRLRLAICPPARVLRPPSAAYGHKGPRAGCPGPPGQHQTAQANGLLLAVPFEESPTARNAALESPPPPP